MVKVSRIERLEQAWVLTGISSPGLPRSVTSAVASVPCRSLEACGVVTRDTGSSGAWDLSARAALHLYIMGPFSWLPAGKLGSPTFILPDRPMPGVASGCLLRLNVRWSLRSTSSPPLTLKVLELENPKKAFFSELRIRCSYKDLIQHF